MPVKPVIDEGIYAGVRQKDNIATVAAVSAVRTAPRYEFFTPEAPAAVSPITRSYGKFGLVDEHGLKAGAR